MPSPSRSPHRLAWACALALATSPTAALSQGTPDPAADPAAADPTATDPAATDPAAADPAADPAAADPAAADPAAASPSPADPTPDPTSTLQTNLRMREIGNQVDELKEETFAAKSRLLLLRASVLQRSVAGSKIIIVHKDDIGAEYTPVQVSYALDRERKLNRVSLADINDLDGQVVIDEKIIPGSHILTVRMVYKGSPWGVFQYMDGYTFTLESNYAFSAEEGKVHEITVSAFEQGGVFTPYEERPTIGYQIKTHELEAATKPTAAATP